MRRRLFEWVERKTGIACGHIVAPPSARTDYRVLLRFGAGEGRNMVNLEVGVNGHALFVTHVPKGQR